MWITELAMNTITADKRIGSHNDVRLTMGTPVQVLMVRKSGHAPADEHPPAGGVEL
jgi:hypothetical protein